MNFTLELGHLREGGSMTTKKGKRWSISADPSNKKPQLSARLARPTKNRAGIM